MPGALRGTPEARAGDRFRDLRTRRAATRPAGAPRRSPRVRGRHRTGVRRSGPSRGSPSIPAATRVVGAGSVARPGTPWRMDGADRPGHGRGGGPADPDGHPPRLLGSRTGGLGGKGGTAPVLRDAADIPGRDEPPGGRCRPARSVGRPRDRGPAASCHIGRRGLPACPCGAGQGMCPPPAGGRPPRPAANAAQRARGAADLAPAPAPPHAVATGRDGRPTGRIGRRWCFR